MQSSNLFFSSREVILMRSKAMIDQMGREYLKQVSNSARRKNGEGRTGVGAKANNSESPVMPNGETRASSRDTRHKEDSLYSRQEREESHVGPRYRARVGSHGASGSGGRAER